MSSYIDTTKPESEQSDVESDDSQFTVAKGPVGLNSTTLPTVLVVPPNLSDIRQQLFELKNSITWSAQQFDQYWPFLDNIWVHNHTSSITKKQTQKSYWYCRLWKDEVEKKSEGHGIRSKRMRVTAPCSIQLVMNKQFDDSQNLLTVKLDCHTSQKSSQVHNHTLEFLDSIKINSAIKLTAGKEVAKGYAPSVVNRNMQGVKWAANLETLKDAGGIHLNLKTVHNAGKDFKKSNPDVRIIGAKDEWEIQMNACFDNLQVLGENILSAKLKTVRAVDKQLSYGVVFTKRCKLLSKRAFILYMILINYFL